MAKQQNFIEWSQKVAKVLEGNLTAKFTRVYFHYKSINEMLTSKLSEQKGNYKNLSELLKTSEEGIKNSKLITC